MTEKYKQKKVAGIGELLWDILPHGKQMGGAPCNFAFHAMQAGFDTHVVSMVGEDQDGREIRKVMNQLGLDQSYVQTNQEYPTGTVTVELVGEGIPEYTIHENVAWDHIVWSGELDALAGELDAVCFGSLAQRSEVSRDTIRLFLETTRQECLRVYDINLRQSFYNRETLLQSLKLANVLKLNEDELPVLAGLLGFEGSEQEILKMLMSEFQLGLIAYTMGSQGSWLMTPDESSRCEVPKVKIADTVGAGDSFTAILLAGALNGLPLKSIHKTATEVAAFVCSRHGATPKLPRHLLDQLKTTKH
jgi:fructokinase